MPSATGYTDCSGRKTCVCRFQCDKKVWGMFESAFAVWPILLGYGIILGPFLLIVGWKFRRRQRQIKACRAAGTIANVVPLFEGKMPAQYAALLKHCKGLQDFKGFAVEQIQKTRVGHA